MNDILVNSSIGIIGGADGPTAIFVTGNPIVLIIGVIVVAALIALIIKKLKK